MMRAALDWETFDEAAPNGLPEQAEAKGTPRPEEPETPRPAPMDLDRLLAAARGEGRAAGFEEGAARAEADFLAEKRLLLAELAERVQDAQISRARAREEIAVAVRRVAEALLASVAPAFARAGLAAEAAELAAEAVREAPSSVLVVRVAEEQRAAVAEALESAGVAARAAADPAIGPLSARVDWADGADVIDLQACIDRALLALEATFHEREKERAHG